MADEEENPTFEQENEEIGGGAEDRQGKRKRHFSEELSCMMYVDILENLDIEFITEMTQRAMAIGRQDRVQVEDLLFLMKFARVKDLLSVNEELKGASRRAFDEANYGSWHLW
uniref:Transcription initiation factor TFIID subunit 13 n=1 Tax=Microcebus murinus TaxID=30608 RepID=A0A8C5VAC3_MICMU